MKAIEQLKEDIIERYNDSWDIDLIIDNLALVQAAKDNFRQLVDKLIQLCQEK